MARPVRRTQAIVPFGVGAMVDFPGPVSLIHAGLDAWPFREDDPALEEFKIQDEERLARRVGVQYFVKPPDFRRAGPGSPATNVGLYLPFLRFPLWHVCPRCGRMLEARLHDKAAPTCLGPVATGKDTGKPHTRRRAVQVRFVTACVRGHLQDFPWWAWVVRDQAQPDGSFLRMISTGSANISGVKIRCEIGSGETTILASRTLSGAFGEAGVSSGLSKIIRCEGHNPALAIPSALTTAPGCGEELFPLLRGASNLYFPRVVSAIYLPPRDSKVRVEVLDILEDVHVWQFLRAAAAAMGGEVNAAFADQILKTRYPQSTATGQELAEAANRRLKMAEGDGGATRVRTDSEEQSFRRQEYELLSSDAQEGYPQTNLLVRPEVVTRYDPTIGRYLEGVSLIHKLRETRAFVGFSRIFAADGLSDTDRGRLISRSPKPWLPASVVRGEGLFLRLNEQAIGAWLGHRRDALESRCSMLTTHVNRSRTAQRKTPISVTPTFVLLHTVAHLLVNQLVYDCGYASASLRERLYESGDTEHLMAGMLIYTAAGDSEGSMGGLVRMGAPGKLEGVIARAVVRAQWCSTDPLCIETQGQGPDNCNLAACHSCALLPETSCEEQNRILDRVMLVGTPEDPELGFFHELIAAM